MPRLRRTEEINIKDSKGLESELLDALKNNETGPSTQALLRELGEKGKINVFTRKYLSDLYRNTVDSDDKCPVWFQDIAIEKILQPDAIEQVSLMTSVGNFICNLLPGQFKRIDALGDIYMSSAERYYSTAAIFGTRDLFLWALLSYRLDLAMAIFQSGWSKDDAPSLIGASLTACKVLNRLAAIAKETAVEKSLELDSAARMYKTFATSITSACFNKDKNKTRQMVLHRRPQWGNHSFIVISSFLEGDESENFKMVLNDLWTGRLKYGRFLTIKLILAIFPPLAFVLSLHEESYTACCNLPAKWRAYYTAPITKFMYNAISFLFHLLAFSYFLMSDFYPSNNWYTISIWEKLVTLWVFGLVIEELQQMISALTGNDIFDRFANAWEVFTSSWNSIDWIMLLLYVSGFIFRLISDEKNFHVARVLYTLSLIVMYIRFLRFATIWRYLGPKVEMIRLMMVRDLPPFLMIFVVYFISFGIAYRVLLFPNDEFSMHNLALVISVPFWQTFGDIQRQMTEGTEGCTNNISVANSNPDIERCPDTYHYPLLVPTLMGIFLVMSNILLLNIVIAVFNQTYGTVGEESAKIHRSNHYSLVEEYIARPVLPSPLNMLEILIVRPLATLVICLYWSCTKRQNFRWRHHCWKLFILLMAGKEADPLLWKRVSGDKNYRFSQSIRGETMPLNNFERSTQTEPDRGDEDGLTSQTSRFDQVTPEQIQRIFTRFTDTDSLRELQQNMDHMVNELRRSGPSRSDSQSKPSRPGRRASLSKPSADGTESSFRVGAVEETVTKSSAVWVTHSGDTSFPDVNEQMSDQLKGRIFVSKTE